MITAPQKLRLRELRRDEQFLSRNPRLEDLFAQMFLRTWCEGSYVRNGPRSRPINLRYNHAPSKCLYPSCDIQVPGVCCRGRSTGVALTFKASPMIFAVSSLSSVGPPHPPNAVITYGK